MLRFFGINDTPNDARNSAHDHTHAADDSGAIGNPYRNMDVVAAHNDDVVVQSLHRAGHIPAVSAPVNAPQSNQPKQVHLLQWLIRQACAVSIDEAQIRIHDMPRQHQADQ
jgi:hypothetical protein